MSLCSLPGCVGIASAECWRSGRRVPEIHRLCTAHASEHRSYPDHAERGAHRSRADQLRDELDRTAGWAIPADLARLGPWALPMARQWAEAGATTTAGLPIRAPGVRAPKDQHPVARGAGVRRSLVAEEVQAWMGERPEGVTALDLVTDSGMSLTHVSGHLLAGYKAGTYARIWRSRRWVYSLAPGG